MIAFMSCFCEKHFQDILDRGSVIGSECVSGLKQLAQELCKSDFKNSSVRR